LSQTKTLINIERNTVASRLAEIPDVFFKLSYNQWETEARRSWFSNSGLIAWKEAACVGQKPEWWFPERGQNDILDLALSICSQCPIKTECLAFAICTGEDEGIWGGTTGRERRKNRKRLLEALLRIKNQTGAAIGNGGKVTQSSSLNSCNESSFSRRTSSS
jgi:WhiB family transcriptional regulator, redox-sensing transcriptional regulator